MVVGYEIPSVDNSVVLKVCFVSLCNIFCCIFVLDAAALSPTTPHIQVAALFEFRTLLSDQVRCQSQRRHITVHAGRQRAGSSSILLVNCRMSTCGGSDVLSSDATTLPSWSYDESRVRLVVWLLGETYPAVAPVLMEQSGVRYSHASSSQLMLPTDGERRSVQVVSRHESRCTIRRHFVMTSSYRFELNIGRIFIVSLPGWSPGNVNETFVDHLLITFRYCCLSQKPMLQAAMWALTCEHYLPHPLLPRAAHSAVDFLLDMPSSVVEPCTVASN